jgi:hypothetical protein
MLVPFASVKLPAPAAAVTPKHVPVFPAVLIVIPSGKVSVKALVSVIALAFVFPIVTVKFVFPPLARFPAAKAFAIVGAASTVRVAFAVPPVKATGPPAVTAVVVFKAAPAVLLVTLACSWQLAPAFSVATFKRRLPSPTALAAPLVFVAVPQAAGVKVKVVFCSVTPTGKVSGNCTVVIAATFAAGFVTVRLRTLVPPTAILAGVKLFATVGGI